ncbi:MAG TPA: S1 RNA-binding domain-containing protein [Anaeromyxobacteraceae bacterium]|nr:S1 RNA-binding domain-containing protein [Anaeromyxobacteraceae bacterium]
MGEKKPESGPVVVRKGHVKPPPSGSRIEVPVVETIDPGAPARPRQAEPRPLWQRLAEEKAGQAPRSPGSRSSPASSPPRGAAPRSQRQGGPRQGPRRERPPRREAEGTPPAAGSARSPAPPPGEPPPAPEAPAPDEGSFAEMLSGAGAGPRRVFRVGEKVAGKILQVGQDVAFLELGGGVAEGMIDVAELAGEDGTVAARPGDIVDGVVVKGGERGVVISRGRGRHGHERQALVEAARTGLPVEGVVKAANKGGLEVEVMGQRAFCPMSQIDLRFVGDPAAFVGQKLRFKVQRADDRDAVLSRRALLTEERAERARATRERLAPGAVFEGTVMGVHDYGAFVDIGGVEGLVHVSELSWDRASKPSDLLKAGDAVQVQVLRVEEDPKKGERIALSVKALSPPPEPEAPAAPRPQPPAPPKVGDVVEAAVDKVEPFGVFVRFAGGRGLVPASETGTPRGSDLRRAFKPGDALRAVVTAIDERGRIRLSKTEAEAAEERREAREYMEREPRRAGKGFGTLGDLLRDKLKG